MFFQNLFYHKTLFRNWRTKVTFLHLRTIYFFFGIYHFWKSVVSHSEVDVPKLQGGSNMTMEGCQSAHLCIINGSLIIIIHKTFPLAFSRKIRPGVELGKKEPPQNNGFVSREPLRIGWCVGESKGERGGDGRLCAAWVSRAETQSLPASAPIRAPRRWRRLTYTSYHILSSTKATPFSTSANPKTQPQIYCLATACSEASFSVANDVPTRTFLLHWLSNQEGLFRTKRVSFSLLAPSTSS